MSKSIRIYIPTRGRMGKARQSTLREFLQYSDHEPILVCPPEEYNAHKRYYGKVMKCKRVGIGPTRQWILDNSSADVVFMVDDDMRFSYRPKANITKLERLTNLNPLVELVLKTVEVDGFIHGGLGSRQGNNYRDFRTHRRGVMTEDGHCVQDCERANNVHFMNREAVNAQGVRMDCLKVMEDFHFTLSLLLKGFPNRIIHDYVWNQEASGKTGGCSLYRTPQIQGEAAEELAAAFPDFVKVAIKKSKETSQSWKGFKERKDVNIRWVKAAKAGGIPDAQI